TVCRFSFIEVPTISEKYFDKPLPDQLEHWHAMQAYVCPKCVEIITKDVFDEKLERDPDTRLFFPVEEIELNNGRCPFHDLDILSTKTTDLPMHPIVIKALPEDTEFESRYYLDNDLKIDPERKVVIIPPGTHLINLSIVTSGKDKRSIHRAERCLQSQGNQMIARKRIWLDIPKSKMKKIDVTVIRSQRMLDNGGVERSLAMYFYAGNRRVTADNLKRIAYMAWDRMIIGMNYRWSYMLLNSRVNAQETYNDTEKAMLQFITEIFPLVEK
ncbi:MAG: exosortase-associated EpsI family protein, partial [Actinobacteria bacterium]|nr:exosortase-associated EpsI family protein [Actinomycetota bacterium]